LRSCFSTLGCPDWTVDQVLRCAEDCGYEGLELRGLQNEMYLPDHPDLAPRARAGFRARFESIGCEIACVSSSARLTDPPSPARTRCLDEARAFVDLAVELGAGLVRLFAGKIAEGDDRRRSAGRMVDALAELEPHARSAGVRLAVETHDDWCLGADLAPVTARLDSPFVGVLWDVNHPYRHGEAPEATAQAVGQLLFHVHMKDGVQGGSYTLFGEGDLPLRPILLALRDMGYAGHLSLEWEKKWHPEIEEPEVALPHFARALAAMLAELGTGKGGEQ
jgi:sugar phosphate isomerase/epimerase